MHMTRRGATHFFLLFRPFSDQSRLGLFRVTGEQIKVVPNGSSEGVPLCRHWYLPTAAAR